MGCYILTIFTLLCKYRDLVILFQISATTKQNISVSTASTHPNRTFTMVAANDVLLDSSVTKYSPSDCQRPEVLNKNLVEGNILLCGYSFNFVVGTASIKKVAETAKALGAAGFVLAVENASPGTKFDPVPVRVPGVLITDVSMSMVSINTLYSFIGGIAIVF